VRKTIFCSVHNVFVSEASSKRFWSFLDISSEWQKAPAYLQLISSLSPACLQLVSSLSPACLQLVSSLSPACLQLVFSLSPACLQLISSLSPAYLQLISSLSPTYLQLISSSKFLVSQKPCVTRMVLSVKGFSTSKTFGCGLFLIQIPREFKHSCTHARTVILLWTASQLLRQGERGLDSLENLSQRHCLTFFGVFPFRFRSFVIITLLKNDFENSKFMRQCFGLDGLGAKIGKGKKKICIALFLVNFTPKPKLLLLLLLRTPKRCHGSSTKRTI